ncbi:MAG: thiamine-phosphate kinase, partial [Acidobacteria bacterium]|nr:thiamine-phosphate kinase [Acidobacteriota bacterium]
LTAGDDYELLVAARPRARRLVTALAQRAGTPLTFIGTCTEDPALVLRRTIDGAPVDSVLPREGYTHFR